ncbi:MAG: GAF domain-containing protein, partial [Candidatus Rokubacteria bacterium]|nr:GAF domain-containing protein [Candidatus Rokubacteria bacterium]
MRWSTRVLLSSLAAVLVPLLVLTAVGVPSIAGRFSQSTEAVLQGSVRAVSALVAGGLEDLQREARLLARDPTIVQGVVKSDWATLARAASPRMLSLTLDRVADLIVVVDERGAPLVRVPASADAPPLPHPAGSADAVAAVRVVSGVPMLLAAAPVVNEGRALGTVVVGLRLEAIARRLGGDSFPMELVFLAGREPAYTTLSAGTAGVGWADAALARRVEVGGTSYLMRSVGRWPDGTLWLLASDADARATQGLLWTWVAGFVLFTASATFAATWFMTRRVLQPIEALGEGARRVAEGDFDARVPVPLGREAELGDVARAFNEMSDSLQRWRGEVGQRSRELEALNAVALTVNRTADLIPTAEATLEVVRRVAEMDVAALYQVEEGGGTLLLIAQRGLSPEAAERVRVRPVEGSQLGKAVGTGRPAVARGLSSLAEADGAPGSTQLALPIPVKGEVWGVMALVSASPREFSPEEMQLMEAVAYQVGVAVERASLFAETREKGQRLESLVGLAQTVTSSLDRSQVLDGVVQAAAGLIPGASVRLWIAEEDRLVLRVEGGIAGTAFGGRRTVFAVGEGLAGEVAATREPLVIERVVEDPRTVNVEWMRQEGYVSFVGVPLLFQTRLLGVLAILTRRLHRPTKDELELLVSFATQAAISIENARLYNEASRSAAEHQALLEVGGLVGSTLKVERVLDLIVERARALLGVRSAGIFKVDPSACVLTYERGIGLSPEFIRSLRVGMGEGTSGKAVRYRAPAWTADILNDTAIVLNDEARALVGREGYRAVLSVPILIKNQPYGVLAVYWWEPHSPTFSEVRLLSALAGQAAVALDNAQLYEAATRREKRLETLGELTRTLTATLSVEEVLERVVESAVELFGSCVSRLWLVDAGGETLSLRAHAGAVSPLTGLTRLRIGEGIVGRIVATRAAIVIPDLREDSRVVNRDRHRAEGVISQAGVPLLLGDRSLGALSVAVRHAHEFSEEEVGLLQSLAHHAAIALENARLFALEQSRRAQVEALVEIERELTAELNPDRLLDLIIQRAGALLEAGGVVLLFDGTSRMLVPRSWYAMPPPVRDLRIPLGVGMAGTAAAERRGLLVNDFSGTAYAASLAEHGIPLLGIGHAMAQPLVSHDRLLGVIAVSREEGGPRFTQGDLETFGSFATQAAIALENARLYREAREHAERLKALDDVNRLVSSSLQVEEVLKNIAQAVSTFFEAPQAHVWVLEPGSQRLRRSVTVGDPDVADGLVDDMAFGEGGVGWVAQHREPILWTDLQEDTRVLRRQWALRHGLRYFTAYPIMLEDRLLGAITMHRPSPYPVTPETQTLLGSLVAQAAVALDNARLYAEAQERLKETQTLLAVGRVLSQNLPTQEAMRQVAREVGRAFGADMVGAYFLDAKKEALRPMAGYPEKAPPDVPRKSVSDLPAAARAGGVGNAQARVVLGRNQRPPVVRAGVPGRRASPFDPLRPDPGAGGDRRRAVPRLVGYRAVVHAGRGPSGRGRGLPGGAGPG